MTCACKCKKPPKLGPLPSNTVGAVLEKQERERKVKKAVEKAVKRPQNNNLKK